MWGRPWRGLGLGARGARWWGRSASTLRSRQRREAEEVPVVLRSPRGGPEGRLVPHMRPHHARHGGPSDRRLGGAGLPPRGAGGQPRGAGRGGAGAVGSAGARRRSRERRAHHGAGRGAGPCKGKGVATASSDACFGGHGHSGASLALRPCYVSARFRRVLGCLTSLPSRALRGGASAAAGGAVVMCAAGCAAVTRCRACAGGLTAAERRHMGPERVGCDPGKARRRPCKHGRGKPCHSSPNWASSVGSARGVRVGDIRSQAFLSECLLRFPNRSLASGARQLRGRCAAGPGMV